MARVRAKGVNVVEEPEGRPMFQFFMAKGRTKAVTGRDFSGEPGSQAPTKSVKLTGNPSLDSPFVNLNQNCFLVFLS